MHLYFSLVLNLAKIEVNINNLSHSREIFLSLIVKPNKSLTTTERR